MSVKMRKHQLIVAIAVLFIFVQTCSAQSDVWLVNARTASWTKPNEREFDKIQVYRLNEIHGRWDKTHLDDFFALDCPDIPTAILIHGNHFTLEDAIASGFQFKQAVLKNGNFRLVIWAWPSEKINGPRVDAQTKAFYSEIQGDYLARFLTRFSEGSKVDLVGFSFGARTIGEAIKRCYADGTHSTRLSVLLLAPAIDKCSVLLNGKYETMFSVAEKSMLIYNPMDKALKYYPKMYQRGHCGPEALGREAIPLSAFSPDVRAKTCAIDVSNITGRQHSFPVYFGSSSFNQKLQHFLE